MKPESRQIGSYAINLGLGANAILALLKTGFGTIGHSEALLADGINSTSDVAYYIVVKIFIAFAGKPPDPEHPYGHHQLESIAALTVGSFVITTAIAVFWDAISKVFDILSGKTVSSQIATATLWIALLTIAAKLALTLYTRRAASQTGSAAILALARDHRNDIFSATGAALGITLSRFGHPWGDPMVGAIVALVILITGIQILRESSIELMGAVPSEALDRQVRAILYDVPGIQAVEEVQAHRFGPYMVLHVTVGVDGTISVEKGDRIASQVEDMLTSKIDLVKRVFVHYHPARMKQDQAGARIQDNI